MELLIHASASRIRYVAEHLVPRLKDIQVSVYCDRNHKGNLKSYLESYMYLPSSGDTWHLEDDVLPDRRFKEWMEEMSSFEGIVCGYGSRGNKEVFGLIEDPKDMWYSFPCIRIPNSYLREMLEWNTYDDDVQRKINEGIGIDLIFHKYVEANPIPIYHHDPCMVEHIDDLIGGSLISERYQSPKAIRFEDPEGLEKLKTELQKGSHEKDEIIEDKEADGT